MNAYQILAEGERYATLDDAAALLDPDYPILTADSVGITYRVYVLREPADGPAAFMVTYLPSGPASLRKVVVADSLPWAAACDLVRDRVAADLAQEGIALE